MTLAVPSDNRGGIELKECFADPRLDAMSLLNEIVLEYPAAISFAPGRPIESLFSVGEHLAEVTSYVERAAARASLEPRVVWQRLGQCGRTNGFINDLIASQLEIDEGIKVHPDAIMVTVGAQEAMAVLLAGLFEPGRDVLLVSDPTYIGITGLARVLGVRVEPVPVGDAGLDPATVEQAIVNASRFGRVRALYDIPDFNNPLGTSLSTAARYRLIDVCHRHGVLLFEDNVYGMFAYDGDRQPTLKALDESGTVIYVGSFSKTLFPGLRVGYLVADQVVQPGGQTLAKALAPVKGLLTVNTPPPLQAAVAAVLERTGGSLESVVAPKREKYRRQRDAMLDALAWTFADCRDVVSWNSPKGGFFLSVTLPFAFGQQELRRCAADHGVIVCPMELFALGLPRRQQIRLAFSSVEPSQIEQGVRALGAFVRAHHSATGPRRDPIAAAVGR